MYIKKVHTLIEQGLQQNGVFAYSDFLKEEIDLQIDKSTYQRLVERFKPLKDRPFQAIQGILDEFQSIQVKDFELSSLTKGDEAYYATLPTDYVFLIVDKSLVLWRCSSTALKPTITAQIEEGSYYTVTGTGTVTYNSVVYAVGSVIKGVTGITSFTVTTLKPIVYKLNKRKSNDRLIKEERIAEVLDNELEKPSLESPVSTLSGNTLYVYYKDFFVDKVFISYIRKPLPVNYNFTTYTTGELVNGTKYEVVRDSIVYNSVTYTKFQTFTANATATFTGTGIVRKALDGDIELPEPMAYKVIDDVVLTLSILSEQNQQKIANLAQKDNVSG